MEPRFTGNDLFVTGIEAESVHHIHILTKDIGSVAKVYDNWLGALPAPGFPIDLTDWMGIIAHYYPCKPVGIEFLQVTDPTISLGRLLKDQPMGLSCLSLRVPDMDKAIATMEALGFKNTALIYFRGIREAWFDFGTLTRALGMPLELIEFRGDNAIEPMPGPFKVVVEGQEFVPGFLKPFDPRVAPALPTGIR